MRVCWLGVMGRGRTGLWFLHLLDKLVCLLRGLREARFFLWYYVFDSPYFCSGIFQWKTKALTYSKSGRYGALIYHPPKPPVLPHGSRTFLIPWARWFCLNGKIWQVDGAAHLPVSWHHVTLCFEVPNLYLTGSKILLKQRFSPFLLVPASTEDPADAVNLYGLNLEPVFHNKLVVWEY